MNKIKINIILEHILNEEEAKVLQEVRSEEGKDKFVKKVKEFFLKELTDVLELDETVDTIKITRVTID